MRRIVATFSGLTTQWICLSKAGAIAAKLPEALCRTEIERDIAVKPMSLAATVDALGRGPGPPRESVGGPLEAGGRWIQIVESHGNSVWLRR